MDQTDSQLTARGFFGKLREKGLAGTFRAGWTRMLAPVRRFRIFLTWVFPSLGSRQLAERAKRRRLLMIYDLSSQPFSIGDILVFQEASLVLREREGLGEVDFALVYDPESPKFSHPGFSSITEENVLYHLASVLPAAQVNRHLGSLFIFNSHHQLQHFIHSNAEQYSVWPPALKLAAKEYFYYTVFNDLLYGYYKVYGRIPHLSCREFLFEWAEGFYEEHVYPNVPVTVQVRNNKKIGANRNLNMDAWLEFFRYCEQKYPVKFIVICSRSELDERLRSCPNVIVAKDELTGLEQDLALIQTAAIHMGASSGPGTMAIFGDKPYLLVNTDMVPEQYKDTVVEDNAVRFFFADPLQRLMVGTETTELLIKEFARMWESVDVAKWSSPASGEGKLQGAHLTWLR
ncbi:MAG TPA: hypothetical protein VGC66_18200 [Pyrinomonadaceae bacterium]